MKTKMCLQSAAPTGHNCCLSAVVWIGKPTNLNVNNSIVRKIAGPFNLGNFALNANVNRCALIWAPIKLLGHSNFLSTKCILYFFLYFFLLGIWYCDIVFLVHVQYTYFYLLPNTQENGVQEKWVIEFDHFYNKNKKVDDEGIEWLRLQTE